MICKILYIFCIINNKTACHRIRLFNIREGVLGNSYMKVVYMCRRWFKIGGLWSGPSLKMGEGLSERPLTGKKKTGDFGHKNTKKHSFLKKRGSCGAARPKTDGVFGEVQAEKWGTLLWHVPIPPPPLPKHTHRVKHGCIEFTDTTY